MKINNMHQRITPLSLSLSLSLDHCKIYPKLVFGFLENSNLRRLSDFGTQYHSTNNNCHYPCIINNI